MQLYTGTKQLKAKPMTRGEYNHYRHWEIPADENPEDAGYLVEYLDGGKSNHPDHEGYISWSPADVFKNAYVQVFFNTENQPPHLIRLAAEHAELADRLTKLNRFFLGENFAALSEEDQTDLVWQRMLMIELKGVLEARWNRALTK